MKETLPDKFTSRERIFLNSPAQYCRAAEGSDVIQHFTRWVNDPWRSDHFYDLVHKTYFAKKLAD